MFPYFCTKSLIRFTITTNLHLDSSTLYPSTPAWLIYNVAQIQPGTPTQKKLPFFVLSLNNFLLYTWFHDFEPMNKWALGSNERCKETGVEIQRGRSSSAMDSERVSLWRISHWLFNKCVNDLCGWRRGLLFAGTRRHGTRWMQQTSIKVGAI